jgi:hypothetical protein
MTRKQRTLTIGAVLRAAALITEGLGGQRPRKYGALVAPKMS